MADGITRYRFDRRGNVVIDRRAYFTDNLGKLIASERRSSPARRRFHGDNRIRKHAA